MPDAILDRDGNPITYEREKYESVGFNADLADEVLAVIAAFPNNHEQGAWCLGGQDDAFSCEAEKQDEFIDNPIETAWSCGTGMCFAGWAVALSVGLDFEDLQDGNGDPSVVGGVEIPPEVSSWESEIEAAATQLLGITRREAYSLFAGSNTLNDLEREVNHLKARYARKES